MVITDFQDSDLGRTITEMQDIMFSLKGIIPPNPLTNIEEIFLPDEEIVKNIISSRSPNLSLSDIEIMVYGASQDLVGGIPNISGTTENLTGGLNDALGNVTGNLTGGGLNNALGNVTGNLTGGGLNNALGNVTGGLNNTVGNLAGSLTGGLSRPISFTQSLRFTNVPGETTIYTKEFKNGFAES